MNKIFLIGNLTREPELTETTSGVQICRFTLAVNRNYANANGEKQVDYFNCIAWRALADIVSKYAKKGSKLAITGALEQREYKDKDGSKKTAYEVIISECELLTPKQTNSTPETNTKSNANANKKVLPQLSAFDDDSDIPF